MFIIVVGYKKSRSETPEVIYSGNDGVAAVKAAEDKKDKYSLFGKLLNPQFYFLNLPETVKAAPKQTKTEKKGK